MTMTSSRPYIIRALYDWILENGCTPYIVVNAFADGVEVPQEHVKDGQIVLNISPSAVQNLLIRDEAIDFDGRFAGIPKRVFVPISSVMGIYSKEGGQGMMFDADSPMPRPPSGTDDSTKSSSSEPSPLKPKKKPSLRVVK
ncbi:MAG: ClpXP protease specificity-enhancing factor [SAR86 cluster bacterium]|uniref:ClpXP protease specificity-enhancing factor n=1 Tax=SAR86 cluster bacterium TaxID=2030880 RepID=A0A2A5B1K0_9GAMM|nr:MAG: ClpXP protease specificity-enhancing factor [SAR86 cluster bacterium]